MLTDDVAESARTFSLGRVRWWFAGLVALVLVAGAAYAINARHASSPELDQAEEALQAVRGDIRAAITERYGPDCAESMASGDRLLAWERDGNRLRITAHYGAGDVQRFLDTRLAEYQVPSDLVVYGEDSMKLYRQSCTFITHD